jgi:UDPglucose--hexose-1-phosphate uridylyltransferase
MSLQEHSHRRLNLLSGEWVLVSPHRTQRPWQGQLEPLPPSVLPAYDEHCYLCPGNARANGHRNPAYNGPYVFDNDFPALSPQSLASAGDQPLFVSEPESGTCRVVCFSEQHNVNLAGMSHAAACAALHFLGQQWCDLDRRDSIGYVQVFENRGLAMGCSNPHPHAQIWATSSLPNEPGKELAMQSRYYRQHARPLLLDYLQAELADGTRVVCQNEHAVALLPFWAVWPYEVLLLPRRALSGFDEFAAVELGSFTALLQRTLRACNRLFQTDVPYSMGFHTRPSDGQAHPEWQLHAHLYPPLLRSAQVRKHLVGFEMLGTPQRDLTPEAAAGNLRANLAD